MKRIGIIGAVLAAMAFSAVALAFDAYFADAAGNRLGLVQEGRRVYLVIKDPEKGACGIDRFQADITVFDWKTGAFLTTLKEKSNNLVPDDFYVPGAWFRELGGIGSGVYFWVAGPDSSVKVALEIGSRLVYVDPTTEATLGMLSQTHVLGRIIPATIVLDALETVVAWAGGDWEYLDQDIENGNQLPRYPQYRAVDRVALSTKDEEIRGRFVNHDTLVLFVRDREDERNVAAAQIKIARTEARISVDPARIEYGCPGCRNIVVTIEDKDENLNPNEIEYVPLFVIVNPGSWNPTQTAPVTNFCSLLLWGPYNADGKLRGEQQQTPEFSPIRWYNIYDQDYVYLNYENAAWWNPAWNGENGDRRVLRAVFFAAETGPDTGVFKFDFGSAEDLMAALGLQNVRFPPGTTIHFYYMDPNDPSDVDLTFAQVGNRPLSRTFLTDANGVPVSEVRLGAGWGGLYIRVHDADANVNACCPDRVVVHICAPHFEDDSEYVILDEVGPNSGIFATQVGIPLLPVWDAVGGYQLVFDDWRVQAFAGDTLIVQYNSVDYDVRWLNLLGGGNPNLKIDGGDVPAFPPAIRDGMEYWGVSMERADRNQYWDVSFAKAKVYDFQVFDGRTLNMRFLDMSYAPVTKDIALANGLYLEVTDLNQNQHPMMRELIFGGWNRAANGVVDTGPIWDPNGNTVFGAFFENTLLGGSSISGIAPTVKIFLFNAQKGTWERLDLRETGVGTGVFRSTVCVLVAGGEGTLRSGPGDTIIALYQDPANHSDIAILSIKVQEGGEAGVIPPVVRLAVSFDRATYNPGDTVTITVVDEQYAGAPELVGTDILVLTDAAGRKLASWSRLVAVEPGTFRVTYVLPADVALGPLTARYTDPFMPGRTAEGRATVVAKALKDVRGVTVAPNPFKTSTTFSIVAEPAGAIADKITITIYDLTGAKVDVITRTDTASVTWTGGNLGNGAYIYVAVVEGAGKVFGPFKGFVYIER